MITLALGTRLRTILEGMDSDVGEALADLGLVDYRPRFSAVVRVLVADGPSTVGQVATALHVTHSAASQTVAEMQRRGLVRQRAGADARQRVVVLTARTKRLLPAIDAEWAATEAAARALDEELPYPLSTLVDDLAEALRRRSFRARIADAAAELPDDVVGPHRAALTDAG